MIKFREKQYTIQEGHYTGPKDLDKVPGYLEMAGKGALVGGIIGGTITAGKDLYERTKGAEGRPSDSPFLDAFSGYKTGGRYGILAGLGAKILLNAMHNPMNSIKFNEVDRNLRMKFGMFQASGFTIGDSMERRNKMEEKFVINDRNVTDYKINIAIQDNRVIMYTYGLDDEEMKKLNKSLDYYCKKYYGMNYTSKNLTSSGRENSYAVDIIFTNYQVLTDFLSEISDVLMLKINLLDSKAVVEGKLSPDEQQRAYSSIGLLDKMTVLELLTKTGVKLALGWKREDPEFVVSLIKPWTDKINDTQWALVGKGKVKLKNLGNKFLEQQLNECGFIEGMHYSVDDKTSPFVMYLEKGILIICYKKSSKEGKAFEKYVMNDKDFGNKNEVNGTLMCTYVVPSREGLKDLLRKIVNVCRIKPNVRT